MKPTIPSLLPSLRALYRLGRVGLHLVYGLLIIALVHPRLAQSRRRHIRRRWSRDLLTILGVRLIYGGVVAQGARMLVANHISWLDIFVINAVEPVVFVSKNDLLGWPLIGTLSRHSETLFLQRGSPRSAHAASQSITEILAAGTSVALFPEGTTTDGSAVLPFRGALLQGALHAKVAVQPVVLGYSTKRGETSWAAAYCGDTSLIESLWSIAAAPSLCASMTWLAPLPATGQDRRALARQCETLIRAAMCQPHGGTTEGSTEPCLQEDLIPAAAMLAESAISAA